MSAPPYLLDMRVETREHARVRLWLPIFLLWPLLLVLGVLSLVLTVLADIALWLAGKRYHYYTVFLLGVFGMLTESRGTSVRVRDTDARIDFTIK